MTCRFCKIPLKELKGHLYHKQRKFQCARCGRIRMQKPKSLKASGQ